MEVSIWINDTFVFNIRLYRKHKKHSSNRKLAKPRTVTKIWYQIAYGFFIISILPYLELCVVGWMGRGGGGSTYLEQGDGERT